MRRTTWPNIAIAVLTIALVSPLDAFSIRVFWKNGQNDQSVLDNFDAAKPDPLKFSRTIPYPSGKYDCSLVQFWARPSGPVQPVPGILNILNSPKAGVAAHYLFFYESSNCSPFPIMFVKAAQPPDMESKAGSQFIFNLMDTVLPNIRSWREANTASEDDMALIRAYDPAANTNDAEWNHSSAVVVYVPDQGGIWRLRSVAKVVPADPTAMLEGTEAAMSQMMAEALHAEYAEWWGLEQAYQTEQAALDTDITSPGFNFDPTAFPMGQGKIAMLMLGYEFIRLNEGDPRAQELEALINEVGEIGAREQAQADNVDPVNIHNHPASRGLRALNEKLESLDLILPPKESSAIEIEEEGGNPLLRVGQGIGAGQNAGMGHIYQSSPFVLPQMQHPQFNPMQARYNPANTQTLHSVLGGQSPNRGPYQTFNSLPLPQQLGYLPQSNMMMPPPHLQFYSVLQPGQQNSIFNPPQYQQYFGGSPNNAYSNVQQQARHPNAGQNPSQGFNFPGPGQG
ncbi:hypothetical protein DRE_04642 [Drechslerella stenobrocha 248]|uniref:Uncharacterized protein n=1 Tax=Drechslerella stenobrocha 248 TaxID=1043628 RepID=W7I1H6_9PEZI|nr:hypothetical protein DRE_04642 [Drechslerella stenobrocha 248]